MYTYSHYIFTYNHITDKKTFCNIKSQNKTSVTDGLFTKKKKNSNCLEYKYYIIKSVNLNVK